jgi:hypothetical protein
MLCGLSATPRQVAVEAGTATMNASATPRFLLSSRRVWRVSRVYLLCIPRSLSERWVEHQRPGNPSMEHCQARCPALPTSSSQPSSRHRVPGSAGAGHRCPRFAGFAVRRAFPTIPAWPSSLSTAFAASDPAWDGGPLEHAIFGAEVVK